MALPIIRQGTRVPAQSRRQGDWDPFSEIDDLWNRMTNLFDWAAERPRGEGMPWVPVVEAEEKQDSYLVRAELPGMRREDVDVEVLGRELVIKGAVAEDDERPERMRRRAGEFHYRSSLPSGADSERVSATLRDGVLCVTIPKSDREQSRQVEITEG